MELEAIIAILISGVALGVSAISLYFTLFHKKVALIGCLAAYKTEADEDALAAEFAFSLANTGNRELLVQEVAIDVVGSGGGDLVPELESTRIPTVLKAGEIKLVVLQIPARFMRNAAHAKQKLQLEFHIFAPDGQLRLTTKLLDIISEELVLSEECWKPFKLGRCVK